jgi:hypothetical protein
MTAIFESQTCSRCGGCGRYSWNSLHGDRCYGCNGRGYQLTKRGLAAQAYYTRLLSKPLRELVPGDLVRDDYRSKFYTVVRCAPNADRSEVWDIETTGMDWRGYDPDTIMRVGASAERKAEAKAEALAYQDTLTKQGKPRKRQVQS